MTRSPALPHRHRRTRSSRGEDHDRRVARLGDARERRAARPRCSRLVIRATRRRIRRPEGGSRRPSGNITRLVTILYATPSEAVIASSRTIGIGIRISVMNDERGDQRQRARDQQAGEAARAASSRRFAVRDLAHDEVDLLHAVRDADREHEERHQHAERIEPVAEQPAACRTATPARRQQSRRSRAGEAHRVAVPVPRRRQQQRDRAELEHRRLRAVGDVADLLGEADDLDLELAVLELRADPPRARGL